MTRDLSRLSTSDILGFDPDNDSSVGTENKYSRPTVEFPRWMEAMERDFADETRKNKEKFHQLNAKYETQREDNIKTLAIFVSLFTFVSFSAQVFPKISHPLVLIGMTLIILGALTFFIFILIYILDKAFNKWYAPVPVILLIVGIYTAHVGYEDTRGYLEQTLSKNFYSKQEIDEMIKLESTQWLSEFKLCLQKESYWTCLKN